MSQYREYLPREMADAIYKLPNHSTIVSADATVDQSVGTPTVTVSSEGDADERVLHFHFKNLRGQDGTVAFDELTENQREMIRGPQGESGSDYVLTSDDIQEVAQIIENDYRYLDFERY